MLISFEGIDKCGKTTVINQVNQTLEKKYKVYLSYESGNIFGSLAKYGNEEVIPECDLYLWWLSRLYEQNISEYKNADIIIKDRYFDTTTVFQKLNNNSILYGINYKYFNIPDITFIFKIDINIALKRINEKKEYDRYEQNNRELLHSRQLAFLDIPNQFPTRNFIIIDVSEKSVNQIHNICLEYILPYLGE